MKESVRTKSNEISCISCGSFQKWKYFFSVSYMDTHYCHQNKESTVTLYLIWRVTGPYSEIALHSKKRALYLAEHTAKSKWFPAFLEIALMWNIFYKVTFPFHETAVTGFPSSKEENAKSCSMKNHSEHLLHLKEREDASDNLNWYNYLELLPLIWVKDHSAAMLLVPSVSTPTSNQRAPVEIELHIWLAT